MGPFWVAFHLGIAMDNARRLGPPHIIRGCGLLGFVPGLSRSHDVAHRNPRTQTGTTLEKNAVDSALGRRSVLDMASELHANLNSLAERRLPAPKRPICCAHGHSCSEFHHQERFVGTIATTNVAFSASSPYRSPCAIHLWAALTGIPKPIFVCSRRSLRGSRQFTCGSMIVGSTRSRYFSAIFMSESRRDSER